MKRGFSCFFHFVGPFPRARDDGPAHTRPNRVPPATFPSFSDGDASRAGTGRAPSDLLLWFRSSVALVHWDGCNDAGRNRFCTVRVARLGMPRMWIQTMGQ